MELTLISISHRLKLHVPNMKKHVKDLLTFLDQDVLFVPVLKFTLFFRIL